MLRVNTKSLKFRAQGMVAIILLLTIVGLTTALTLGFTGAYTKALLSKSSLIGQEFKNDLAKALNLGLPLDSLSGVSEKCMAVTGKNENIGYCMVIDTDGLVLFSDDSSLVGKVLKDDVSRSAAASAKEGGEAEIYKYNGLDFYDTVVPLFDADQKHVGALRIGLGYKEVNSQKVQLLIRSSLIGLLSLLISIALFAVFINAFITKPILSLVKTATQIAGGDLTKKIDIKSEDELGELGRAINLMVENLKNMLARVKEASKSVAAATDRIAMNSGKISEGANVQRELTESTSSSMEEMNASIKEIADSVDSLSSSAESSSSSIMEMAASIDQVASSASTLASNAERTSSAITEMSASVRQVADNVDILSRSAEETTASATQMGASIKEVEAASIESNGLTEKVTTEAAELGMKSVEKTIESMNNIKETVDKAANVIEQLGARSEEIGDILNVIDEVNDQTSLLALNAAILAAQAGEHGKGFAVVANEIKELAERTSSSTQEIARLIGALQAESKDAVVSIRSGKQSVEKGVMVAHEGKEALVKIVQSSTKAAEMSKSIERATVEQSEGIRQVTAAMMSISDMVQQILKATKEQDKGNEQIMDATEKVRELTSQVGNAMLEQAKGSKQITMAVENVTEKVQHIAAATAEQSRGSEEIVNSVDKIRDISHRNVKLAEEMDLSVKELTRQAELLNEEMNRFTLMSDYNLGAKTLRIGIVSGEGGEAEKRRFASFIKYLESNLGMKVEAAFAAENDDSVDEISKAGADFFYMGPSTYIEARHRQGVRALMGAVFDGKTFNRAVIVTTDASGIRTPADVSGRSFAFGSEESVSSHFMPRTMLAEAGVSLQDLKEFKYLGGHDAVARAVLSGKFEAGAMLETVAAKYTSKGLRVVQASDAVPNHGIAASKGADDASCGRLTQALAGLDPSDPVAREALDCFGQGCEGFMEVSDSDYAAIRRMTERLYGMKYA